MGARVVPVQEGGHGPHLRAEGYREACGSQGGGRAAALIPMEMPRHSWTVLGRPMRDPRSTAVMAVRCPQRKGLETLQVRMLSSPQLLALCTCHSKCRRLPRPHARNSAALGGFRHPARPGAARAAAAALGSGPIDLSKLGSSKDQNHRHANSLHGTGGNRPGRVRARPTSCHKSATRPSGFEAEVQAPSREWALGQRWSAGEGKRLPYQPQDMVIFVKWPH